MNLMIMPSKMHPRGCLLLLAALVPAACGGSDGNSNDDAGQTDAGQTDATDATPMETGREVWPDLPMRPEPTALTQLSSPCSVALGGDGLVISEDGMGRVVTIPKAGLDAGAKPRDLGVGGAGRLAALGNDLFIAQRGTGNVVRLRDGKATSLATGQVNLSRIRAANGYVYWIAEGANAATDGSLRRVSIEGGTVEDIATMLPGPRDIAVGTSTLFVTLWNPRIVASYPIAGGAFLAQYKEKVGNPPMGIVLDEAEGAVYWTAVGPLPGGFLHRTDTTLMTDMMISITPPSPSWLALDEKYVYWQNYQTITRAPREGGMYIDVQLETAACEFLLDAGTIVWTEPVTGRVYKLPLP